MPVGTAAFQTFDFTGFPDSTSVSWGQPQLSDGLHQFSDIVIAGAVPEPSVAYLFAVGMSFALATIVVRRRGRRPRQP